MKLLRQSTSVTPKVGPFLGTTDGATASTGLTIAQADCLLFTAQGAGTQKHSATGGTHDTGGMYAIPFDTTDTGTLGHLKLLINKSGAFPVWDEWMVVTANVYDSLIAGSATLATNAFQIAGVTQNATNLGTSTATMQSGTVDTTGFTATTIEFETNSITTAAANHWTGRVVIFGSGTLNQQAARITAYSLVSGRGHFTVNALTSAPASGVSFVIV